MIIKIDTTLSPHRTMDVIQECLTEHTYTTTKHGFLGVPHTEFNVSDIGGKAWGEKFGNAYVMCHTTKTMTVFKIWGQ